MFCLKNIINIFLVKNLMDFGAIIKLGRNLRCGVIIMTKQIMNFVEKNIIILGTIFLIALFGNVNVSKAYCDYELMGDESFFACSMANATFSDQSDFSFYRQSSGFYSDEMYALYNNTQRYIVYDDYQRSLMDDDFGYDEMMSSGFGLGGYQVNSKKTGLSDGYFMHYTGELSTYLIRITIAIIFSSEPIRILLKEDNRQQLKKLMK
jgi:hypothetical protein